MSSELRQFVVASLDRSKKVKVTSSYYDELHGSTPIPDDSKSLSFVLYLFFYYVVTRHLLRGMYVQLWIGHTVVSNSKIGR